MEYRYDYIVQQYLQELIFNNKKRQMLKILKATLTSAWGYARPKPLPLGLYVDFILRLIFPTVNRILSFGKYP